MATKSSLRRTLLLSFALSIMVPSASSSALADNEPPQLRSSDRNLTAPAPEIKPAKKKRVIKKENFEQLERHKDEGYYGTMNAAPKETQKNNPEEDGYYSKMPETPKEYPKEPEPPKYVPPTPEPVPVAPQRSDNSEPGRKFDDDTGASGSITYTRNLKTAEEMLHTGHWDVAKKHYMDAIHVQPDNPAAYPGYVEALQKGSDWSGTQHAIEKLVQLQPTKEKEYAWQLAEAFYQMQKFDKSTPLFKKALGYGHHQEQIHRMLLKTAQMQNNNAEVLVEYNALTKMKPNDYKLQIEYGALLERLSKPQEAIAHYKAAVAANPADGATLGRIAYMLMATKDFDGAIAHYQKAMAADPTNAKTYQDGIAYCQQQKNPPKKK